MKITIGETEIPSGGIVVVERIPLNEVRTVGVRGPVSNLTRQNGEVSFNIYEYTATIKEVDAPEWLVDCVWIEIDFVNMTIKKI